MFAKLFLLFAILPLIEIALLINVAEQIGGWNTVGLVILTAFTGAFLVRQQGLSTLIQAQRKMQTGGAPGQELAEGMLLVVAGVLLVTPGFVTDVLGFLFALPMTRPFIARTLMSKLANSRVSSNASYSYYQPQDPSGRKGDIIEGEFEAKSPEQGADKQRIGRDD